METVSAEQDKTPDIRRGRTFTNDALVQPVDQGVDNIPVEETPVQAQTGGLSKNPEMQKRLIEASLYVSGRPLDLKTLGSVIGARSEEKIRALAMNVAERYRAMDSSIQVIELPDGRWVMQLRAEMG